MSALRDVLEEKLVEVLATMLDDEVLLLEVSLLVLIRVFVLEV